MGWVRPALQIGSALFGASQQKKASSAQKDAATAGLDWTKSVYGDSKANFAPYLAMGQTGLSGLSKLAAGDYSGFQNSPDYLYARDQMQYGLDHSAAANGRLYSGGYGVDMAQQLGGLASQNLGNYRNSLQYLTTGGQNAAGSLGGIGTGTSQQVNQGYQNVGDARASGYGANAAAFGNVAGVIGGLFGGGGSSYGGGSSASNFGLPAPVSPYSATGYGSGGSYFG